MSFWVIYLIYPWHSQNYNHRGNSHIILFTNHRLIASIYEGWSKNNRILIIAATFMLYYTKINMKINRILMSFNICERDEFCIIMLVAMGIYRSLVMHTRRTGWKRQFLITRFVRNINLFLLKSCETPQKRQNIFPWRHLKKWHQSAIRYSR